ncbi:NUCLEOTIDE-BINDING ALPHA-BETA PLAIT DOMAIN-CONTAINING PROTEIN-RELATED [Salix viminalis]|uniref:NUCLEOTIDE-BINDING ALPHA-BETA PLAIT DOMAIN-CONTAINING PROTEIN-RELATED n=1 Tax=Salix viminalis TaxID=40686 RepID=A0A9Q0UHF4_SALVM|nr:NUCLEOTIDE-BINDING ALPHA-BETA PLAIT DOMAIN-CONTAINING PROTEIN-RELATED [Salix viminalis]
MPVSNKNPETGSQFPEADLKARCLSLLVADLIRDRMNIDEAKLFVGGISRETSEETLRTYFSKALQDNHVILGRTVEVKKAIPKIEKHHYQQQRPHHPHGNQEASNGLGKNSDNSTSAENNRTKKIFVGGLASSLTEEQFKNYFEQFGRTVDVVVMQDSLTNRPRGFGFVTFDSEESVDKVLLNGSHELNGKRVEVKKAVPKDRINGHIVRGGSNGFVGVGNGPRLGNHPFYGYGRPGFEVAPMTPMLGAGLIPYSNACLYPAYAHDMSSIGGMEIGGHNRIAEGWCEW